MKEEFNISDSSLIHLPMDVLKLYNDNAQKRLEDYHKQANDTTGRAYKLISVYLGILTLLCGYLYVNWAMTKPIMGILALAIGLGISTGIVLKILLPRTYIPLGRSPQELQPEVYGQYFGQFEDYSDEKKMKYILRDELKVLQKSIDDQELKNKGRTFLFTLSFIFAISGIIASVWILLI